MQCYPCPSRVAGGLFSTEQLGSSFANPDHRYLTEGFQVSQVNYKALLLSCNYFILSIPLPSCKPATHQRLSGNSSLSKVSKHMPLSLRQRSHSPGKGSHILATKQADIHSLSCYMPTHLQQPPSPFSHSLRSQGHAVQRVGMTTPCRTTRGRFQAVAHCLAGWQKGSRSGRAELCYLVMLSDQLMSLEEILVLQLLLDKLVFLL